MKRLILIIIATALLAISCRKEADYVPYIGESGKLAYSTYTEQFEYIWKCISTGYVFWDVDTVDWDAAYRRFKPKFQALDNQCWDNGFVPTAELDSLYNDMMGSMRDHHMVVVIRNLHPAPGDETDLAQVYPGRKEVYSRDYYFEHSTVEQASIKAFLADIESHYTVAAHDSAEAYFPETGSSVSYVYCLITLDDGRKIPYLWQSMAAITPVMREQPEEPAGKLLDRWFRAIAETPRNQLAGIILDNRANRGGYQDDLDYLVGSYLNQRTCIMKTRYKEGPGRLEHSAWTPYYINPCNIYHRDLTAENIPYVVLCDVNSVSMGEIEPMIIRSVLPTAHTIGERTFGGTGPLQPVSDINLNYGGPFGNYRENHHYVYTSTFEAQFNGKVLEGVGFTPDEVILRKEHGGDLKSQLDAAVRYISNQ